MPGCGQRYSPRRPPASIRRSPSATCCRTVTCRTCWSSSQSRGAPDCRRPRRRSHSAVSGRSAHCSSSTGVTTVPRRERPACSSISCGRWWRTRPSMCNWCRWWCSGAAAPTSRSRSSRSCSPRPGARRAGCASFWRCCCTGGRRWCASTGPCRCANWSVAAPLRSTPRRRSASCCACCACISAGSGNGHRSGPFAPQHADRDAAGQ